MNISRREALLLGLGGVAFSVASPVLADKVATDKMISDLVGDGKSTDSKITINANEIAENGNSVPIGVTVDSPMTEKDYVKKVAILADGNPTPEVAIFHFTPMSGKAEASIRMRMAKTQNIIVVAMMSDGSYAKASTQIKVTVGGCGG